MAAAAREEASVNADRKQTIVDAFGKKLRHYQMRGIGRHFLMVTDVSMQRRRISGKDAMELF